MEEPKPEAPPPYYDPRHDSMPKIQPLKEIIQVPKGYYEKCREYEKSSGSKSKKIKGSFWITRKIIFNDANLGKSKNLKYQHEVVAEYRKFVKKLYWKNFRSEMKEKWWRKIFPGLIFMLLMSALVIGCIFLGHHILFNVIFKSDQSTEMGKMGQNIGTDVSPAMNVKLPNEFEIGNSSEKDRTNLVSLKKLKMEQKVVTLLVKLPNSYTRMDDLVKEVGTKLLKRKTIKSVDYSVLIKSTGFVTFKLKIGVEAVDANFWKNADLWPTGASVKLWRSRSFQEWWHDWKKI